MNNGEKGQKLGGMGNKKANEFRSWQSKKKRFADPCIK